MVEHPTLAPTPVDIFESPLLDMFGGTALDILILFGVVVDILFIVFFRWILQKVAGLSNFWATSWYLFTAISVSAVLTGPAVIYTFEAERQAARGLGYGLTTLPPLASLLCEVSTTNMVDGILLLVVIAVMAVLLTHRLVWPLLKRLIYAANRKQLIKNSKLLGTLGTMLLLYAFPDNPIVKPITRFLPNLK
jgi:hypothetical protein